MKMTNWQPLWLEGDCSGRNRPVSQEEIRKQMALGIGIMSALLSYIPPMMLHCERRGETTLTYECHRKYYNQQIQEHKRNIVISTFH